MEYEEFFKNYLQDIYARSEAEHDFSEVVFTERVCDFLVDQAVLENYTVSAFKKKSLGLKVDAYDYSEDTDALTLIISDFNNTPETLTQTNINNLFKKVTRFFERCIEGKFHHLLEESDPGFKLARDIFAYSEKIRKVRFIVLSTSLLSRRVDDLPESEINGIPGYFDVWDLGRIQRIEESGKAREDIIVDFTNESDGLPCLPAFTGEDTFESYLIVMPGTLVASLYDKYGERLLEQNVRTFLQFRGNVNKGIRNTIVNEPHMFFAYNNGITATAEEVVTESSGLSVSIKSIKNLQIVNGGQTTASLFNTQKSSKNNADISRVYVQVKLTVIPPDQTEEIVPKISEYANTQNKVSAADFFSNHPFHLRVEEISRRLWAPSSEGKLKDTHWYYERVRGQYANAQTNLSPTNKKQFQVLNPRNQMFVKTDLAKYESSWDQKPHIVCLGAQKNFVKFAENVAKSWAANEKKFNELYFKRLIAKAIIFKTIDKSIFKQPWYGGLKAQIVTYTMARFSKMVEDSGMCLNLEKIWNDQALTDKMTDLLILVAEKVNDEIQNPPASITNISEWCKKELCWTNIQKIPLELPTESLAESLISNYEKKAKDKDAKEIQSIDNGILAQKYVLEKGASFWSEIISWSTTNKVFSPKETSLLQTASEIPFKIPSEKQSLLLLEIEKKANREGFNI